MRKQLVFFLCAFLILTLFPSPALAAPETDGGNDRNRCNVAFVLDASGSMKWTDEHNYRYQAIRMFLQMLTEQGNVVGGVVFSEGVDAEIFPVPVESQEEKDRIYNALREVDANGGWTNIGIGIETAVDLLLRYGDPENPSVVILLSDGNTDMRNSSAMQRSMERQSNAIQLARENGISLYSVCLNQDGSADTEEMLRISGSPEKFQNISSADDLDGAFDMFYNMIFKTSTRELYNGVIPPDERLETDFYVPGIGVEEVNIIFYGNFSNLAITRPDESPCVAQPLNDASVTTMKITDLQQGTWHLSASGISGDRVKINMKYNTQLVVRTEVNITQELGTEEASGTSVMEVSATIGSPDAQGTAKDYEGFQAEAVVTESGTGQESARYPMRQKGAGFSVIFPLSDGTYLVQVHVTGNDIDRTSPQSGPYVVTAPEVVPPENHPPLPVDSPVTERVLVFPTGTPTHSFDLTTLAEDPDGDPLTFTVEDSSLLEDTDYTVENGILTVTRFPLQRAVFTVRAVDSGGLSCTAEYILASRHVAWIALGAVCAAVLLGLIVFALWLWRRLGVAFMGSVYVESLQDRWTGQSLTRSRGRIRLSSFSVADIGLSGRCYFQASGHEYVTCVAPWPHRFYTDADPHPVRKVRIPNGMEVFVYADKNRERGMRVEFTSTANDGYDTEYYKDGNDY